jgi:hypothetical protein
VLPEPPSLPPLPVSFELPQDDKTTARLAANKGKTLRFRRVTDRVRVHARGQDERGNWALTAWELGVSRATAIRIRKAGRLRNLTLVPVTKDHQCRILRVVW